jgi:hypothetical protein
MISIAEKTRLTHALTIAFNDFIASFSAFDEEHINHPPIPGSWTPTQVALHIILATDGVPDEQTKALNRPVDALLPKIRPWWEDLNQKFESPELLSPDNKPRSKQNVLSELHRVRDKDLAIITEKDLTAICLDFELPTIGYLSRYEWLWFIEMHLKRHNHQLQNMLNVTAKGS